MPPSTAVAELQQKLFKRIGVDLPGSRPRQQKTTSKVAPSAHLSRKLQRKNQRAQKKFDRYSGQTVPARRPAQQPGKKASESWRSQSVPPTELVRRREIDEDDVDTDSEDDGLGPLEVHGSGSEDEAEDFMSETDDAPVSDAAGSQKMSSAIRQKLAQDDAEIDEFARKLGIKKGRKSLPQAFQGDGLDELLSNLDEIAPGEGGEEHSKRKREYDEWLSAKRQKTRKISQRSQAEDVDSLELSGASSEEDEDDKDDGFRELDSDDESSSTFESNDQIAEKPPKQIKEDPYRAPIAGSMVAKYVPPSRRQAQGSDSEARSRLQKQIQGQINRLTEANILSIVQATEQLYQKNARGDVTELLTTIIMAQMQGPDNLSDQFFVLTGGFSAAIYKVIGSSFGSHLVREVAKRFGQVYETCHKREDDSSAIPKEASNMIGFLSQLYLFEVVSCRIIFDYMERFLENLSELNVELLLRICRAAGRSLRKDDPNALKHITSILSAAVAKVGYPNISARTKFMIETLDDLKNSKSKARGVDSSVVSDHVLRIRKRLGELKSLSRRLDGLAPMGMGLDDIEQADTAGKWWLVGASVPVKDSGSNKTDPKAAVKTAPIDEPAALSDNEDMNLVLPDYSRKARDQGFNTMAQIAIFTAVMSATSHEHGYQQYIGLGLKRTDQLEIARVLVQCVGSETQYNEYYALLAKKACANNSKVRFAFQDRLWRIFRSLGESMFGGGPEAEETADSERMKDGRRISHVARFYASLVSDGVMTISILKPLNLLEMNEWTSSFVEWFIISLLRACRSKGSSTEDVKVRKVFGEAARIALLAAGIVWFLRTKMRKTDLLSAPEVRKLERVREKAQAVVQGDITAKDLS